MRCHNARISLAQMSTVQGQMYTTILRTGIGDHNVITQQKNYISPAKSVQQKKKKNYISPARGG
jgi:hypothetical protein